VLNFEVNFPRLKEDEKGNNQCISCGICVDFCPTHAIDLRAGEGKVELNIQSLEGPKPKHFVINKNQCIQCRLCIAVCPVAALTKDFSQKM
jgi:formate hydrogenlyase subunit 6/NADH:ubiquinone oxidoreductase subunit I